MKVEIQKEWFSEKQCNDNHHKLYVFGDNTLRIGKGGQAQIRDCANAIGVATKIKPTMEKNAFFNDDDIKFQKIIDDDLKRIIEKSKDFDIIVFPADGLGTGLSRLPELAPYLYRFLLTKIKDYFGINLV